VLKEIEWLLTGGNFGAKLHQIQLEGSHFVDAFQISDEKGAFHIHGYNIDVLKRLPQFAPTSAQSAKLPKLVLLCIKDVGSEPYYIRRGFKSLWEGPVPVGMWGNKKECTTVYMEMELK
jgi:hypothetical protein